MKELPPLAPPYTGGETNARRRHNATMQRVLPLCKGELEGVVSLYISSEFHQNKKNHDFFTQKCNLSQ